MIVPCECGAKLKIDEAKIGLKGAKIRCPRCGNILQVAAQAPRIVFERPLPEPVAAPSSPASAPVVLIAHDSEAIRGMIEDVLVEAGFRVDTATDGVEALKKASDNLPQAMVLDVGLPGIYGFELCERLKENEKTKGIKIVLLTSVYDTSRYRRSPVSLYGAEDYIEKHQISEYLGLKIRKLLYPEEYAEKKPEPEAAGTAPSSDKAPAAKGPERPEPAMFSPGSLLQEGPEPASAAAGKEARADRMTAAGAASWLDSFVRQAQDVNAMAPDSFTLESSIFQKKDSDIPAVESSDPEAIEKAKRLARIIVSDIALYNPETAVEGIKNGTFFELLKNDVNEGRELYERRVSSAIRSRKDYYMEAFDNFITAQRKNAR